MKKTLYTLIGLTFLSLVLVSCKDDEDDHKTTYGTVKLKFDNGFDGQLLSKNTDYITEEGDTFQVTIMDYYISNVVLVDEEGHEFIVPNSYHFISFDGKEIEIVDVPSATYTYISFALGVDSSANHDISRGEGDLDPNGANGMIWSWNTDYKFLRLEGAYRGDSTSGSFTFHIGGDKNYKTFQFGTKAIHSHARISHNGHDHADISVPVNEGKTTSIGIRTNVAEVFKTPNTIDLDIVNKAHGANGTLLSDNYTSDFFKIHHVAQE